MTAWSRSFSEAASMHGVGGGSCAPRLPAQGSGSPCLIPNLHEFSHRQIIDLMGNAFNAASYLTALAVAMSIVDLKSLRLNV